MVAVYQSGRKVGKEWKLVCRIKDALLSGGADKDTENRLEVNENVF